MKAVKTSVRRVSIIISSHARRQSIRANDAFDAEKLYEDVFHPYLFSALDYALAYNAGKFESALTYHTEALEHAINVVSVTFDEIGQPVSERVHGLLAAMRTK